MWQVKNQITNLTVPKINYIWTEWILRLLCLIRVLTVRMSFCIFRQNMFAKRSLSSSKSLGTSTIENWAISWDYGTFRAPYTHSSNAHEQPSSGARCLIFGRTLRLLPYFMCANSEGSGETARIRRLARAFTGRLCDKYHNLMSLLSLYFQTSGKT